MAASNDNPTPAARMVPIIGTIGDGERVTFYDTPAARAFLRRVRAQVIALAQRR